MYRYRGYLIRGDHRRRVIVVLFRGEEVTTTDRVSTAKQLIDEWHRAA